MSKKIQTRLVAVIVVGLRKFLVSTWMSALPNNFSVVPPLVELLELRPRLAGESLEHFNQRAVTSQEQRRAKLIIVNGRVVKSMISERDPAPGHQVEGPTTAAQADGCDVEIKTELSVGALGVTTAMAAALGLPSDAGLNDLLARATRLVTAAGNYPNGSVLEALARALRMTTSTGADPLLARVTELVNTEATAREGRMLARQLQEVLQLNPDIGHTTTEMLVMVHKLVEEKKASEARAAHLSREADALLQGEVRTRKRELLAGGKTEAKLPSFKTGKIQIRVIDVDGDNLTGEELAEAIKLATGGPRGAQ